MPTSQRIPKSMRRFRTSRVCPNWRSLTRPPPFSCDSRLMKPLFASCSHAAVTLKSKALSSSSADTTRVTSAARAEAPHTRTARTTTARVVNLWTAALKVRAQCNTRAPQAPIQYLRALLAPRALAQPKLLHLGLEALARDLELAG